MVCRGWGIVIFLLCFFAIKSKAQDTLQEVRLKLFLDCKANCDMTFLRTKITVVDFVLDNTVADVFVLVTKIKTGGGGDQYQLIFFGQKNFSNLSDTLTFDTSPTATDFIKRELLANYIKIGLVPYLTKTKAIGDILVSFKETENSKAEAATLSTKDKWNYWVFLLSANGYLNSDQIYKVFNYNSRFAASRVTDKLKVSFSTSVGKNKKTYDLNNSNGYERVVVINEDYNFYHQLVKSLGPHWSYGYETNVTSNNFSNNKLRLRFSPAIEYDIFPYKDVNTKFFTIRYGLDVRQNAYYDTTVYNKINEVLFGQGLNVYFSLKQRWGTTSFGMYYHSFLHNLNLYNVGMNAYFDIRITGGLSFNINAHGAIIRDQLSLARVKTSEQDILIQRRQLATGYNFWASFGVNYRFGSKLNNFVNPRFEQH